MKRDFEREPKKCGYHGAGPHLGFHEFSIRGISKRQDNYDPVERIEEETGPKPEVVINEAVEVKSDRYEGCDDYGESDCDKAAESRKLSSIDLFRSSGPNESTEADKYTGDFCYRNE
jgi:hypothetical protein